jgi:hypothetical protein
MQIPIWLTILLSLGVVVGLGSFFLWLISSITNDYAQFRARKEFQHDVVSAIPNSQPTWDEIVDMAATRNVTTAGIDEVLRRIKRDVLTGRLATLQEHRGILDAYLSKHREKAPFDGLPNDMRLHLERIREQIASRAELLEPLTAQIRELVRMNEKDKRHQRYYTVGGFFVGFVSLIFAAYTYLYPPPAPAKLSFRLPLMGHSNPLIVGSCSEASSPL